MNMYCSLATQASFTLLKDPFKDTHFQSLCLCMLAETHLLTAGRFSKGKPRSVSVIGSETGMWPNQRQ